MTKLNIYAGFDVSKAFFDVCILDQDGQQHSRQISFDKPGLEALVAFLPKSAYCIMEATGAYHSRLAFYLYQTGYRVSVVNPLVIKRYAQMKLLRAKTDRADARLIACFGKDQHPDLWEPPAPYLIKLQHLQALQHQMTKHCTALKCQREAFNHASQMDKEIKKMLDKAIGHVNNQIELIDKRIEQIIEQYHKQLLQKLISIPGIGKKTAAMLIVISDAFKKFENYKQLSAYIGLSPRIYRSGSSIKGKSAICKMGMGRARALLYLCAWSAKRNNSSCKMLFERLVARGKSKRLALIAVANKLIKQVFAIAIHNTLYKPDYQKNICF